MDIQVTIPDEVAERLLTFSNENDLSRTLFRLFNEWSVGEFNVRQPLRTDIEVVLKAVIACIADETIYRKIGVHPRDPEFSFHFTKYKEELGASEE